LRTTREVPLPYHDDVVKARAVRGVPQVIVTSDIGMFGYFAGPAIQLIDPLAIGDPLLARLPARSDHWRIGHFERRIPDGYLETVQTGRNVIIDPAVARLYDNVMLMTRGSLWSRKRWRAIVRMNLQPLGSVHL
jgi:arabinofuranosyltransferase